jgi:NADH-quinone oxidoreductase subunit J
MSLADLLLYFFAGGALLGGVLMLFARHPMRVALALIGSMLSLAGIYAVLGVHVIAVFQVLIYVGAVMVFMVYVIMLLDVRDASFLERYSGALLPSVVLAAAIAAALGAALGRGSIASGPGLTDPPGPAPGAVFEVQPFSVEFLEQYWLHFELTSVLLLAAVVAAIAVIKAGWRRDG